MSYVTTNTAFHGLSTSLLAIWLLISELFLTRQGNNDMIYTETVNVASPVKDSRAIWRNRSSMPFFLEGRPWIEPMNKSIVGYARIIYTCMSHGMPSTVFYEDKCVIYICHNMRKIRYHNVVKVWHFIGICSTDVNNIIKLCIAFTKQLAQSDISSLRSMCTFRKSAILAKEASATWTKIQQEPMWCNENSLCVVVGGARKIHGGGVRHDNSIHNVIRVSKTCQLVSLHNGDIFHQGSDWFNVIIICFTIELKLFKV